MPYEQRRRGHNDRRNYRPAKQSKQTNQKPEVTEESSDVLKAFLSYQHVLDEKHDRHERLVKLSRDVTIESKRAIFIMQRVKGLSAHDQEILTEAQSKFDLIHQEKFYPIAVELIGQDPYQYARAYTAGMQEYIEAVSFHHYLSTGELISMKDITPNLTFKHQAEEGTETTEIAVHLSPIDYMLGIADLTGELMRVAVNSVGQGDFKKPFEICPFLQKVHGAFVAFGNIHRELPRKLNVLKASLNKVENVCYTVQIRGSEFPKHILAEMLKNADIASNDISDDMNFCADG